MKKFYKVIGITLGACFSIGIVLAIIGAVMGAKGVLAFTKDYGIKILEDADRWSYKDMDVEAFSTIYIEAKNADVNIEVSKNGKYGIEVNLLGKEETVELTNKNGTLSIKDTGSNLGFTVSLLSWESYDNTITIYVPENAIFDRIDITCDAGDIDVADIGYTEVLNIVADAGDIDVNNGICKELSVDVSAGDVTIDDIEVTGVFKAYLDVGDLDVTGRIAADMHVEVNVGDVCIDTGMSASDFKYEIYMNLGDIEAFGKEVEGFDGELSGNPDGKYSIYIKTDVGDITID